jgi:hypothetical protein
MYASMGSNQALEHAQKAWHAYQMASEPWREGEYTDMAAKAAEQFEEMSRTGAHFEVEFTEKEFKEAVKTLKKEVGNLSNALDKKGAIDFSGKGK